MASKTVLDTAIRKIVAVIPELALARACYQGAVDTIAGEPPGVYLYGLVLIEMLGLAWLRLTLAPLELSRRKGLSRTLLGVGATGAAFVTFVLSLIMALVALLFVMFFDPRTFVLLLLALTRRSIWGWNWSVGSINDAEQLQALARRTTRAHYLALLGAFLIALLLASVIDDDSLSTSIADALWLGGMSAYFIALAIYLLVGKTPGRCGYHRQLRKNPVDECAVVGLREWRTPPA